MFHHIFFFCGWDRQQSLTASAGALKSALHYRKVQSIGFMNFLPKLWEKKEKMTEEFKSCDTQQLERRCALSIQSTTLPCEEIQLQSNLWVLSHCLRIFHTTKFLNEKNLVSFISVVCDFKCDAMHLYKTFHNKSRSPLKMKVSCKLEIVVILYFLTGKWITHPSIIATPINYH